MHSTCGDLGSTLYIQGFGKLNVVFTLIQNMRRSSLCLLNSMQNRQSYYGKIHGRRLGDIALRTLENVSFQNGVYLLTSARRVYFENVKKGTERLRGRQSCNNCMYRGIAYPYFGRRSRCHHQCRQGRAGQGRAGQDSFSSLLSSDDSLIL